MRVDLTSHSVAHSPQTNGSKIALRYGFPAQWDAFAAALLLRLRSAASALGYVTEMIALSVGEKRREEAGADRWWVRRLGRGRFCYLLVACTVEAGGGPGSDVLVGLICVCGVYSGELSVLASWSKPSLGGTRGEGFLYRELDCSHVSP
jgi:hypothetical protein